MGGQWLGGRQIRTNWATRKPPAPKAASECEYGKSVMEETKKTHKAFFLVFVSCKTLLTVNSLRCLKNQLLSLERAGEMMVYWTKNLYHPLKKRETFVSSVV